jgi:membrane-associated phospholipid phosphatase
MRGVSAVRTALVRWSALREIGLVVSAVVAYFGVRNFTAGGADVAYRNADRIQSLEGRLGISWEGALQSVVLDSSDLVTLANWVYIWGHWPVIVTAGLVLYHRSRLCYRLLRNAIFVSGGIGFLFFALFPVAPPRLADPTFADTVTQHSNAYRALQPPGLTNQFAAFPSLHFGWNLLVGVAVFLAATHLLVRMVAVVFPLLMGLAVVATANHYVLDVAGGLVVVLAGLAVSAALLGGPATLVRWPSWWRTARETTSRDSVPPSRPASPW